jgi:Arc/MetJ family transcription regulator
MRRSGGGSQMPGARVQLPQLPARHRRGLEGQRARFSFFNSRSGPSAGFTLFNFRSLEDPGDFSLGSYARWCTLIHMRTNVELDDELVREAFALTGLRTKRELLHEALKELVRARRKRDLADLVGKVQFRDDFDAKALREIRRGHR